MTIRYSHFGLPNLSPYISDVDPTGIYELPTANISFRVSDDRGYALESTLDLTLIFDPGGPSETSYDVIVDGSFEPGYGGSITVNAFGGFDVLVTSHPDFPDGSWRANVYVEDNEGATSSGYWTWAVGRRIFPTSPECTIFDLCEPDDSSMLVIFEYWEVTPSRPVTAPWVTFNGDNDLCLLSNDYTDSGFRMDLSIPSSFTYEFTILPTALPADFSDLANHRFFTAVYNQYQNMAGLLISENGGVALARTGTDPSYEQLPDTADIFDEGLTYYTFRVVVDHLVNRGHLFITRKDLLPFIGHQLRYSFPLQETPAGLTDHVLVECVGSSGDPTNICIDCLCLADYANMPNQRPIAVPGDDKTRAVGQYASFDGSESYDPDGDIIQAYWWTITYAPVGSDLRVEGLCGTDADATGSTMRITGSTGLFSDVTYGDLLVVGDQKSPVIYVDPTGSELVVKDRVVPAGMTDVEFIVIKQTTWNGNEVPPSYKLIQSSETDPSLIVASGTGDSIAFLDNICTLTDAAGLFTPNMVGNKITIAGASDSDNNGTFTVVSYVSPTEITYSNPVGAAEPGFVGTWTAHPVDLNMYRVLPSAIGAWSGHDNELAVWLTSAWVFYDPGDLGDESLLIYDIDAVKVYRWNSLGEPLVADGLWYEDEPNYWELGYWDGRAAVRASMLTDHKGLHIIELIVSDGDLNSIPVEVVLNVFLTDVQLGLIPDLSFVWDYLPDFWDLVPDRDKIDTIWSAFTQIISSDLMALWQHDYSKSLRDIQRVFQRQWLSYDILYEEPNYEELPATVQNDVNEAGWSATPNVQVDDPVNPGSLINSTTAYDLGVTLSGLDDTHVLVLEGVAYQIARIQEDTTTIVVTRDQLPTGTDRPSAWMIRPTVVSTNSDFTLVDVNAGDQAVFKVRKDDEETSVTGYVWGVKEGVLSFDDEDLAAHLADPDASVLFYGVLRRSGMQVDDLVTSVPRLQEVINLRKITDAPSPLYEDKDFLIDTEFTTILDQEIVRLEFLNAWFPQDQYGYEGEQAYSGGVCSFKTTEVDFHSAYGEGADLTGYLLEIDGERYRLKEVLAADEVELYDVYWDTGATDLSWKIRKIEDPPDTMWAEITYLDNKETIEANFGRLVGFPLDNLEARTDNLDYLSAVQGLWYSFWFGPTPNNMRNGAQILLGLPFAQESGTITDISSPYDGTRDRILVQDEADPAIYRTYYYPTEVGIAVSRETGVDLVVGDFVNQFDPLSKGVQIEDWASDPDWINSFAGSDDLSEVQKIHYFLVRVKDTIADLTNLLFMIDFVLSFKPKYTYPFFVVLKEIYDTIDIDDALAFGPRIPTYGAYPQEWDEFSPPIGWNYPAPSEENDADGAISRVLSPTYDQTTRWPNDRFFLVPEWPHYGNVHLFETPGRTPSTFPYTWPMGPDYDKDPAISSGARRYDQFDGSGKPLHLWDEHLAPYVEDLLANRNGHCDDDVDPGPGQYWELVGTPTTAQRVSTPVHLGARSIEIDSSIADEGVYNVAGASSIDDTPTIHDEAFQIATTGWIYLVDGSAVFRLVDQDGSTVLAEGMHAGAKLVWRQFVLHGWKISGSSAPVTLEVVSGPAGGHFYLDTVEMFTKDVPWNQWGYDRHLSGRTGGYTIGGDPDEYFQIRMHTLVP